MKSHPAIRGARLAILHGQDPVKYLGIDDPVESWIVDASLQAAEDLRVERLKQELEAQSKMIGAEVAKRISKMFS